MTCPARKVRHVTFDCCGAKSCMARTYSSGSVGASSSEPESIVGHADEGFERAEAEVGVVGMERWAEWGDRCEALVG